MDVLGGSVDLRELLASGSDELDASSPLSSPDLRLLIDRLQLRSLSIQHSIASYLRSHHKDFCHLLSTASDASSEAALLSESLSDALSLFDARPFDVELRLLLNETRQKRRELSEKKDALDVVRVISEVSEKLSSVNEHVHAGRLPEASKELRDLQFLLSIPDEWKETGERVLSEEGDPAVLSLMRTEWIECFERLQSVLVHDLENTVRFVAESGKLMVGSELDNVQLQSILTAFETVGILEYGFGKVADLLNKTVFIPIISSNVTKVSTSDPNDGFPGAPTAIISLESTSLPKDQPLDVAVIYVMLVDVIAFAFKFICFENGRWMQILGGLTWPQISDSIIKEFLSKIVLSETSRVAEYEGVLQATEDFERMLRGMMFIPVADGGGEKLCRYIQDLEVHFASRKKNEIVAKARKIILLCDFSLPMENTTKNETLHKYTNVEDLPCNGGDMILWPNVRVLSSSSSQLMELVHKTLKDATESSTKVALQLYHAARDSLLLYRVIVPVKLEKQLETTSQAAMLIYNDLLYLHRETLGLAFEYRSFFPSDLRDLVVFVDIAPSFHQLAEEIMHKQIQMVNLKIKEAFDGANGFQDTHQRQNFESAKFAIDQVVFVLEKLHILWEPLLIPAIYRKAVCNILDCVFSRITQDMLQLDDLGAEETLQLQRLIYVVLENLSTLFESLIDNKPDEESSSDIWFELEKLIPSLSKLRKLADMLDLPLKSITTAWENGSLVCSGFTTLEVQDFIKAIFADSPLRKECLCRIESAYS